MFLPVILSHILNLIVTTNWLGKEFSWLSIWMTALSIKPTERWSKLKIFHSYSTWWPKMAKLYHYIHKRYYKLAHTLSLLFTVGQAGKAGNRSTPGWANFILARPAALNSLPNPKPSLIIPIRIESWLTMRAGVFPS